MKPEDPIYEHFVHGFERAAAAGGGSERRIGAELKFPLVNHDGTAANYETVCALWEYLCSRGWQPVEDTMMGEVVGARKPGDRNDTVASCETGYCKPEFSLAHVANLFDLQEAIQELRDEIGAFAQQHDVHFLGYGIQPVTRPSMWLLMKNSRARVWDKVFLSNRIVPLEHGHDLHLFTINAASHVHISVSQEEAVPAVNVLNGFACAQIALTANSNIWRGRLDPQYKCVAEKFWDWWMPEENRVGLPERPFTDLKDYVETVAGFRPVYVRRSGKPILLKGYSSFKDYFQADQPVGVDMEGKEVPLTPERADIDLHSTCCWHNARISHHCTVENRANDQQPPGDLICVAALTLGLIEALQEASRVIFFLDWEFLRAARERACREALRARVRRVGLSELAAVALTRAQRGLESRGLGEEAFLAPLQQRLRERRCPADEAERLFKKGGVEALVAARKL